MGKQSSLGPINPQVNGVPAKAVVEEFEKAVTAAREEPSSIPMWQVIIGKYHPTFIDSCSKAWTRSLTMVTEWLSTNMLLESDESKIKDIVNKLANIGHEKGHDAHITKEQANEIGLVVDSMEDDNDQQDLILTVHHAYIHTLSRIRPPITKIIENHNGIGMFNFANPDNHH
jgi:hypothetical protein